MLPHPPHTFPFKRAATSAKPAAPHGCARSRSDRRAYAPTVWTPKRRATAGVISPSSA